MEEEVLEQEVVQEEPQVETPVEEPVVEETPAEVPAEEPAQEGEPAENVQLDAESGQENVQEEPVVEEEPVAEPEPQPEPLMVRTKGEWKLLSELAGQEFETGKTYHISIKGKCQFMMSAERPTFGIETNEITFTKEDGVEVWIKTRI